MITANSTSQSVLSLPGGISTSSFGPITVFGAFEKTTGSDGTSAPASAAWPE
jgi:hypothetical protein